MEEAKVTHSYIIIKDHSPGVPGTSQVMYAEERGNPTVKGLSLREKLAEVGLFMERRGEERRGEERRGEERRGEERRGEERRGEERRGEERRGERRGEERRGEERRGEERRGEERRGDSKQTLLQRE
ncbi:hypothetical protein DUI87_09578 [Hirundo rustica rustica]|uniref:Uncharacterized protein n=1 Tax=Hirundo rustica rustica TaxID=333673 RepID=A0A3M0KML9_HIRRU|nr:hypothetical protein DUI87_09578 [Hirundo rustica rustica]